MNRGYFEVGIYRTKCAANVGTLWRSAFQLGAAGIFTIGKRFPHQAVAGSLVMFDRQTKVGAFQEAA